MVVARVRRTPAPSDRPERSKAWLGSERLRAVVIRCSMFGREISAIEGSPIA